MKRWYDRSAYIPMVGLWLILYGMQEAVYSTLDRGGLYREMIVVYGFVSLLIIFLVRKPKHWIRKIPFLFIFFCVSGFLLWKNWHRIVEDARILVYYINQKYQIYTGQELFPSNWCLEGNLGRNVTLAVLCGLLGVFIAWSAIRVHSKVLITVPVILLYCGALLLGVTPGQFAVLFLMIGMTLEMLWISEGQRRKSTVKLRGKTEQTHSVKRVFVFVVLLAVTFSLSWFVSERMSGPVFRDVKQIQKRQQKFEKELQIMVEKKRKQVQAWFGMDSGGYLSNLPPEHLGKEVFSVTVSKKPENSMYLRGFVGDIYHGGKWKASQQIAKSKTRRKKGIWKGKYNDSYYLKYHPGEGDITVKYTNWGKRSKYLYLPYGVNSDFNQISKKEQELCLGESDDTLELYQEVAEEMPQDFDEISEYLIKDVQSVLWRNAEYSLSLDPLPGNRDYAEFFLFYSQKGYCEHFATAGTLLLRNMNYVARYVSGYRISPNQFVQNQDGTFTAQVLDSDAHAWSEVWVRDQYWMPQEMTPSDGESEGMENIVDLGEDGSSESEDWEIVTLTDPPAAVPLPEPTETQEPKETKAPASHTDAVKQKNVPAGHSEIYQGGNHGGGSGTDRQGFQRWWSGLRFWQRMLVVSAGILLAGIVISILFWWRRKRKQRKRMAHLRTNNRRHYIRVRLSIFLNRLRHAGLGVRISMPEDEWIQELSEKLQNRPGAAGIERAAELIRRAAYSREIITEREVDWFDDYCEKIEVWAKNQKKIKKK